MDPEGLTLHEVGSDSKGWFVVLQDKDGGLTQYWFPSQRFTKSFLDDFRFDKAKGIETLKKRASGQKEVGDHLKTEDSFSVRLIEPDSGDPFFEVQRADKKRYRYYVPKKDMLEIARELSDETSTEQFNRVLGMLNDVAYLVQVEKAQGTGEWETIRQDKEQSYDDPVHLKPIDSPYFTVGIDSHLDRILELLSHGR